MFSQLLLTNLLAQYLFLLYVAMTTWYLIIRYDSN